MSPDIFVFCNFIFICMHAIFSIYLQQWLPRTHSILTGLWLAAFCLPSGLFLFWSEVWLISPDLSSSSCLLLASTLICLLLIWTQFCSLI
jgi:hypothetical protein